MDSKEIRELIELISRSNFASFELEGDGFKVKLVKESSTPGVGAPAPAATLPAVQGEPLPASPAPVEAVAVNDGSIEVHSPIVGTYYRSPGPELPPFIEIGSTVKKGQVLCIVEAMKVMNEIESEIDGEVLEILVANGQPVEYGEVMFRLRPLS